MGVYVLGRKIKKDVAYMKPSQAKSISQHFTLQISFKLK
jgi:hypothetical protein